MSEREQRIRIAVVDDHEMFRAGVIATLQPHFDVVGQAADVEGSVAMIAQTKPDVVLLDVQCRAARTAVAPKSSRNRAHTPPIPSSSRCPCRILRRMSVP